MAGSGKAHLSDNADEVLLRVENLTMHFPASGGKVVHAVTDISFDVRKGETLGLVGESGCGKSTTGKAILQMPPPTSGSVVFDGTDLTTLKKSQLREQRTQLQMIFQDPISSINPRKRIIDVVADPLRVWNRTENEETVVADALEAVGLEPELSKPKKRHEFSGGQCQRICIARALVLNPKLIICDEPVSALDVSVQAQILNILEDLKQQFGLTLVFIAHDLAVVKNVSDRVAVMYLGKMCEVADPDDLYHHPAHPYTNALLSAIPIPDPAAEQRENLGLSGELPSPMNPPSGCRFRTRCPRAEDRCAAEEPQMREIGDQHFVACHFPLVDTGPAETPVDVAVD